MCSSSTRPPTTRVRWAWRGGASTPTSSAPLHLRYFDELPVPAVLELLDCSRDHYENLTKRALRKLRDALVGGTREEGCRRCRTLVLEAQDAPLAAARAVERDAHLDGCLACRAFLRRSRGLMAALPLPAVGLADRLLARLQGHFAAAPDAGEAVAGATAVAGAGAMAGGAGTATTGALGLAGASGVAKAVAIVCSAGAVTAGVCLPVATRDDEPRRPPVERRAAAAAAPTTAAPPATAPAPAITPPPAASPSDAPAQSADTERRRSRPSEPKPDPDRETSPFLPESAAPEARPAPAALPASPAPTGNAAASTSSTPPATADPAPLRHATAAPQSAFSQEFTP